MGKSGRDGELIMRRNKKLAARYYFYAVIHGLNTERVIGFLQLEFDLSENRIETLLKGNTELIQAYERSKTTVKQLSKEFPFFSWRYSPKAKC